MTHRPNHSAGSTTTPERAPGRPTTEEFRIRRGVKALVTTPRRVLLIRERHIDGTPFWTLPGGGARQGEPDAATLRRELLEELRCRCTDWSVRDSFLYVHRSFHRTASVYTIFECTLLGEPTPVTGEVVDARWFHPSETPPTTLPGVVAAVERIRR